MKIGRILSLLLIGAGVFLISFSLWNIFDSKIKTAHSLEQAKEQIEKPTQPEVSKHTEPYNPQFGGAAGILELPTLSAELPIVEGTDPDNLEKGVGHYKGSYYPDEQGQIVLSGHRDTVFRQAGKLKIGDPIQITVPYGSFDYQITRTKIVDSKDTSIITLQHQEEELILTTCYPFRYIGNAPQRYIIYAERTK